MRNRNTNKDIYQTILEGCNRQSQPCKKMVETPDKGTRGWNVYGTRWPYSITSRKREMLKQVQHGQCVITAKAFTLIELLVVVLIIGILAAVAVPQYQLVVYKARYTGVIQMMKNIKQANRIYFLANGSHTNDVSKWDISLPEGSNLPSPTSLQGHLYLPNGDEFNLVSAKQEGIPEPLTVVIFIYKY